MSVSGKKPCGGCEGKGGHIKWCAAIYGEVVGRLGTMSQELDAMGDNAPPAQANILWGLASKVRVQATTMAARQVFNDQLER